MTPRVKIDAISDDCSVEEAVEYYLTHTHTRLPVYTDTIDRIDYFIT
jgi:CBS domain containing-hemolysin-like protein